MCQDGTILKYVSGYRTPVMDKRQFDIKQLQAWCSSNNIVMKVEETRRISFQFD